MFLRLLFLLTFIPFLEIYFLIRLSDNIGFSNTILLVLLTGIAGAWLLRKQGHSILMEIQQSSSQGHIPSDALAKGFFTFIGGVLLLTPGILTDGLGFSLIFPGTQILWKKYFMSQWESGIKSGNVKFYSNFGQPGQNPFQGQNPFENQNPFETREQQQRRFDPNVIDIDAQSAETVDKKEDQ